MVSWADVKTWKSSGLDSSLDTLTNARKQAMRSGESIVNSDISDDWRGAAADAGARKRRELEDECEFLLASIGDLITATSAAQDGVGDVELFVNEAIAAADHYGFSISESGEVSDTFAGLARAGLDTLDGIGDFLLTTATPRVADLMTLLGQEVDSQDMTALTERMAARRNAQDAVNSAIQKANEVDTAYKEALDKVVRGEVSEVEDLRDTPGAADAPPVGASSEEVAAWWNSLTEEEQARQLNDHYRQLGNLDGIDGATRDAANRRRLSEDGAAIDAKIADLEEKNRRWEAEHPQPTPGELMRAEIIMPNGDREENPYAEELAGLRQQRNDMLAIAKSLQTDDTQLLVYDPATGEPGHERMHAAVAVGDVDTADHVTTFVPGMTTTVEGKMESMVGDMERLKQHSEQVAGNGETVAAIAWIGYDAPQSPLDGDLSVTNNVAAERGGERLAGFQEGLYDSRSYGVGDPHTSVGAHSYGSTTASEGLQQIRPGVVDDVVVYGSPGTVPGYDINVPEGHKYVLKNANDPVTAIGGALPIPPLGKDPANDPDFTQLDANNNFSIHEHSTYLEEDSTALDSLSRVVAGKAG
ncbi:MAG: hypothetical protein E7Z96_09275 [Actinomycetaceae bacterium]|nr:hypothetical protein [Actinomycetaceae bacterium]